MLHIPYVLCVFCCSVYVCGLWCLWCVCGVVVLVRVVFVVHVYDVVARCAGDVEFVFMCVCCCGTRCGVAVPGPRARALAPETRPRGPGPGPRTSAQNVGVRGCIGLAYLDQACFKCMVVGDMCMYRKPWWVAILEVLFECLLVYYVLVFLVLSWLAVGFLFGLVLIIEVLQSLGFRDAADEYLLELVFRTLAA